MKWKLSFILLFLFSLFMFPSIANAQSISGNTYFYDQQFNVSYGSFPAWSNGFGESGTFPTSTYHTVAKSVNSGPYINTVRDVYVSNTSYSFTAGNSYKLTLVFNIGSYLLPQSSALYGLTNNRNLSLCRLYGQSTGNMTCSISWADSDETMIATVYMNTQLSGSGFELQIGNLNAGTNCFVYNSSFDYSQGIKLTSADIIQDNSATDNIINNQNNNTTNIINNQNNNTQSIINNQNQNTQQQIESQRVCSTDFIDKNDIVTDNSMLSSSGSLITINSYGVTDFIRVTNLEVVDNYVYSYTSPSLCFYNSSKSLISCVAVNSLSGIVSLPSNTEYIRSSIYKDGNVPTFKAQVCKNGNQALNDSLTDSNTSSATAEANSDFGNFTVNQHGLTDILNTVVTFIGNVASQTCTSLSVPLPFVNQSVTLPCMSTIYSQYPTFYNLYQLITTGLIAYRVIINLIQKIKQLCDPNYDKIEVIQL